ncbi:MAG: sulfite exporter TauE/SafE family protein [Kamptonema sp. SIO4C4]|nr:sulfite exporter TauE/SafE family protein [Kamptonema sp. SIO4C4]
MDGLEELIGISLVMIAGVIRGFSGFGSAMILAPSLSLLFNPQQVVATILLLEIIASVGLIPEALPQIKWQQVLPMALAAIVTIPVGTYFLVLLDPDLMRRIIGGLLLIFVLLLWVSQRLHVPSRMSLSYGVGALSGFLTGLTGMGGPPVVLYELSRRGTVAANRANLISFFALTQFVALGVYYFKGILSMVVFQRFLLFFPSFLVGLIIGSFLFKWVNENLFRNLVFGFLVIIGLLAISI